MTRTDEAKLAFVGNGEVLREPLKMSDFADDEGMRDLIREGMVEARDNDLIVTRRGWRFLDTRNEADA